MIAVLSIPAEAFPFLASALLAILGAISSYVVSGRVPDLVRKLNEGYKGAGAIPPHLTPDGVGKISAWAADTAQCGVALIGPPVAALALVEGKTALLSLAYVAIAVLGALVFARMLFVKPDRYARRTWFKIVTPIAVLAVTVNVAMAALVTAASG